MLIDRRFHCHTIFLIVKIAPSPAQILDNITLFCDNCGDKFDEWLVNLKKKFKVRNFH